MTEQKEDFVHKVKKALKDNTAILDPYAERIPPFKDMAAKHDMNAGAFLGVSLGVLAVVVLLL